MSPLPLVVVLCGGRGTRLGELTADRPKPLLAIHGRPFLEHQVDMLERAGFDRFLFLTGYKGELIEDHFRRRSGAARMQFSREDEALGTGGALVHAAGLLPATFLLLNGDSYLAMDYGELCADLARSGAVGVLAAYRNAAPSAALESNNLALEGAAVRLYQKRGSDPRLTHMDAGAGVYRRTLLDFVRAEDARPLSLEETVWPRVIARGLLLAKEVDETPYDIGTPQRLDAFAKRLA